MLYLYLRLSSVIVQVEAVSSLSLPLKTQHKQQQEIQYYGVSSRTAKKVLVSVPTVPLAVQTLSISKRLCSGIESILTNRYSTYYRRRRLCCCFVHYKQHYHYNNPLKQGSYDYKPYVQSISSIDDCQHFDKKRRNSSRNKSIVLMVRNIDLPEAIILYGLDVCFTKKKHNQNCGNNIDNNDDDNNNDTNKWPLRDGLRSLIDECNEIQTPVVVLTNNSKNKNNDAEENNNNSNDDDNIRVAALPSTCIVRPMTVIPPNPYDLVTVVESLTIKPFGFGGSSGFGRKQADPERSPYLQRTVVLVSSNSIVGI
jgi:hypothetical protein